MVAIVCARLWFFAALMTSDARESSIVLQYPDA